jgi:hypothetical protein
MPAGRTWVLYHVCRGGETRLYPNRANGLEYEGYFFRAGCFRLNKNILNWLLQGPPWLVYAVESQLLDRTPDPAAAVRDPAVVGLVARLRSRDRGLPALGGGRVHYTETGKAYWDLFILADIGLSIADLGLREEAEAVFGFQSADGTFRIPPNVRPHYYCMSAILVAALAKMGYRDDPRVAAYSNAALRDQQRGGGWDCYGDDYGSCPMDNLNLLMLLAQYEARRRDPALDGALDCLLSHWERGDNRYGFGVGRRFRALTYPAVKYGVLRVLDVLSLFPRAVESPAFTAMLDHVRGLAVDGRYYAAPVDDAYTEFDFGQTGEPSRWLTFLVSRIERRAALAENS